MQGVDFCRFLLVEYFEAIPGVPRLQDGLNPATWMLQVSARFAVCSKVW